MKKDSSQQLLEQRKNMISETDSVFYVSVNNEISYFAKVNKRQ